MARHGVGLASALPTEADLNGLNARLQDFIDEPDTPIFAVVVLQTRSIITNIETGTTTPTVEVKRVEPLGKYGDVSEHLKTELLEAAEKRTGKRALPIDQIDVDPDQGSFDDGDDG